MIASLWNTLVVAPILNLLVWFSVYFGSVAYGVIGLVIVIKLLTLPITIRRVKDTKILAKLQPELSKLKKRFKNKVKFEKAKKKLYAKYNYHPSKSFLSTILMFPVLIALYQSVRMLTSDLSDLPLLYKPVKDFVLSKGGEITTTFLGLDLLSNPNSTFLVLLFFVAFLNNYVNFLVFGKSRMNASRFEDLNQNTSTKGAKKRADDVQIDPETMLKIMKFTNYFSLAFNSLFMAYIMRAFPTMLGFYIAVQYLVNSLIFGILYIIDKYINPKVLGSPKVRGG